MKTKVGILTWHDPTNCGSALQAYALHSYLNELGVDTQIIRYVPQWCRNDYMQMPFSMLTPENRCKRVVKDCLLPFYYFLPAFWQQRINPFFPFYFHYCRMTVPCTENTVSKVCKKFTTVISGSDQIWNPSFIDPIFLQIFVDDNTNKISYAVSLGVKIMPKEHIEMYKNALRSYHAISVRENEGCEMLKSMGVKSDVHVDPTLLLSASHYRSISKRVMQAKRPFAFCYFLPTDRKYNEQVQKYVRKHNLEAVGLSANKEDYHWIKNVGNIGPLEWLWLVDNADVVLTNSYHATLFSLIFHTPFLIFMRFSSDDTMGQNSRLEQLDYYFDIAQFYVEDEIQDKTDYSFSKFEERLSVLQNNAKKYLMNNIK